jgi:hypothetical protein
MQALVPVLETTNQSVEEVFQAQTALSKQLATMAAQLEQFVRDHPEAPSLGPKLAALRQAQGRMRQVNQTLAVIQARLERLYDVEAAAKR